VTERRAGYSALPEEKRGKWNFSLASVWQSTDLGFVALSCVPHMPLINLKFP
jgi:hypothetical protein